MKNKLSIFFSACKVLVKDTPMLRSLLSNSLYFLKLRASRKYIVVSLTEHVGDIIAAEPISRHLKSQFPEHEIIWIVNKKYIELLQNNPAIKMVKTVTCFTEWILLKKLMSRKNLYDLHISGKVCEKHGFQLINLNAAGITIDNYFHKGNLLFCFSKTARIEMDPSIGPIIYLPAESNEFNGNTVVIHTSANSPHKNWRAEGWNKLVIDIEAYCRPEKIIEIGFSSCITIVHPKLIRYCGEKELGEIRALIEECSLFIGVDSGFAHMANALEKNSIILIGKLNDFKNSMPYSGKFLKEASYTIIYSDKPLHDTSYNELRNRFIELLKHKETGR